MDVASATKEIQDIMRRPVLLAATILSLLSTQACSDDATRDVTGTSTSSSGGAGTSTSSSGGPAAVTEEVSGAITASRTLAAGKDYLLKGLVQVKAGVTLTIDKGVTLKGDSASKAILLIEPGATIMAEGTADEPIVFTSQAAEGSRRAGDWGGLVILGNAPVNFPGGKGNIEGILSTAGGTQYGGSDVNDSSGKLRYVRVEYAGVVLSQDNEVNGITFGGVGRGTVVDHIQVRHALDDCFEFFGGTVDAKYLICQYNQDDGFDFDNGYAGRLQFLVLQQDPVHPGEDNGIESDNDAMGSTNAPFTNPQVYNATLVGKNADPDSTQYGMLIRRNSRGTYRNMLVQGFESALDIRDATTKVNADSTALTIRNSIFAKSIAGTVMDQIAYPENGATAPNKDNDGGFDEINWFKNAGGNSFQATVLSMQPFVATAPNFAPASALNTNAATPPGDGFFDATANYIGAFKDMGDNWATTGNWVKWTDR